MPRHSRASFLGIISKENGRPNGFGFTQWKGSGIYEGTHSNENVMGNITGKGRMIYYDGSMAIGEFVDGVLHGEGEYWSSDGSTHHKGQFMLGSFVPQTYKG